ncbi:hypothetical protein HYH02_012639 [Chlamydomonas schloesseri]|uniref:Uncharacterized protein n=1 Tax=Chlamydomonas schloesseri TaxID=2026947 RepID=A0A835T8I2_9CHLO|nr:hypothetical protein HYH02_012639 [Chlamydomonas schloesseri]|eukprot:KAG2433521.1 hypothetical protein HYH02_012639 [Chlamydomonas schloesseri]
MDLETRLAELRNDPSGAGSPLSYAQAPLPGGAGPSHSPCGQPSPSGGSLTLPSAAGGRHAPVPRRASFIAATIMRASAAAVASSSNQVHPAPGGAVCGGGSGGGTAMPPPRARAEEDSGDGGDAEGDDGDDLLLDTDENGAAVGPGPGPVASGRLSGVLHSHLGAGVSGAGGGVGGASAPLLAPPGGAPPDRRFPMRRSSLGDMRPTGGAAGSSRGLVPTGVPRRSSLDIQRPPPVTVAAPVSPAGAGRAPSSAALPAVSRAEAAAAAAANAAGTSATSAVLMSPRTFSGSQAAPSPQAPGAEAAAVAVSDELTDVQSHFLPSVNGPPASGYRRAFASEQHVWVQRDGSGGDSTGPVLAVASTSQAGAASGSAAVAAVHAAPASGAQASCSGGVFPSGLSTRFAGVPVLPSGAGSTAAGAGAGAGAGTRKEHDVDDPIIAAAAAAYWESAAAAEAAKRSSMAGAAGGRVGSCAVRGGHGHGASSPGAGDGSSSSCNGGLPPPQQHFQYQPPHASSPQHDIGAAAAAEEPAGAAAATAAASSLGSGGTSGTLRFCRLAAAPPALGMPGTGLSAARTTGTRSGQRPRRLSFETYAMSAPPLGLGLGCNEAGIDVDGPSPPGLEGAGGQAWAVPVGAAAPRAAKSSSVSRLAVTRSCATPFGGAAAAGPTSGSSGPLLNTHHVGASNAYIAASASAATGRRSSLELKVASPLLPAASGPAPSGGGSSPPGGVSSAHAYAAGSAAASGMAAATGSHSNMPTSLGSPGGGFGGYGGIGTAAWPASPGSMLAAGAAGAAALVPTRHSQAAGSQSQPQPQAPSPVAHGARSGLVRQLKSMGAWRNN